MNKDWHVAIIMDGNGRWAKERNKKRIEGHRQGMQALEKIIEICPDEGVRYLTLFAFSSENWKRPADEVSGLMDLFQLYLQKEKKRLHKEGACVKFIGDRTPLPVSLQSLMQEIEETTKNNSRIGLQIAMNYGGRQEILRAAQKLISKENFEEALTQEKFEQALDTYPFPDPDFLIRTGGERRLSNYLLWQMNYTELYFTDIYWPDFTIEDFRQALNDFSKRQRRFGGI